MRLVRRSLQSLSDGHSHPQAAAQAAPVALAQDRDPDRRRRRARRRRRRDRRRLGAEHLQLGAAALEPETGAEGPLLGDLRRRRQPDRVHPLRQHPPAGPRRRRCRRRSRTRRSRSRTRTSSSTARSTRPGIARAAWKDVLAGGKPVQGASTITQQLVRNLYIHNPEDTLKRKLNEAHLADDLFEAHSQRLDPHPLPQHRPLRDGRRADRGRGRGGGADLLRQAGQGPQPDRGGADRRPAAGALRIQPLPRPQGGAAAPQRGAGDDGRTGLHHRQPNTATRRTAASGSNPGDKYQVIHDPFLFDLVQQELIDKYGINTVRNGGLKAYTTIDPDLQEKAEAAVATCSESGFCYPEGGPAAGLASVDPNTGAIVALASTEGYASEDQFNYAWQAAPPARLLVQDLRADDRDQAGHRPRHDLLRRHLADDPGAARRRHLDGQQRRARRRRDVARRGDLELDQRRLRPARPRRRLRKRHRNRRTDGDRSAAGIGAGGGDRRSRHRRHAAGNGRRLRDPRQRRHPPRPDRDQPGRIPRRQGRRSRQRRRRPGRSPRARPTT